MTDWRSMGAYECGCERGGNCTKTTNCKIQTAIEDYEEALQALKLGVWRAINVLDNDLHACRAINARAELQVLINQFGEPDYEGEE